MPRYRLTVEYHGGPYVGWQRQNNGPSVQQALETALAAIDPNTPTAHGAGRTDAGVHALGQVMHTDLARDWAPQDLCAAVNSHLGEELIAVLDAVRVAGDFNARFDATEREYVYRIRIRPVPLTLDRGLVWHRRQALDVERMAQAAARLVGRHDFTTFRDAQCQAKSPVRTLDVLEVQAPATDRIEIRAVARSFLHHQVRSMVGTLERVGADRWSPDDVATALAAIDRSACGPVAPPDGLYLKRVRYGHGSP